jgi:hypothetical protein
VVLVILIVIFKQKNTKIVYNQLKLIDVTFITINFTDKIALYCFSAKTVLATFHVATSELNRLCAAESTMVFHAVKHSHSYISQACTINLNKKCFPDSSVAKNITQDVHSGVRIPPETAVFQTGFPRT